MTTNTVGRNRRVIHCGGRRPGRFTMTGIAFQTGYDMTRSFTLRINVVVTRRTGAIHLRVIHR